MGKLLEMDMEGLKPRFVHPAPSSRRAGAEKEACQQEGAPTNAINVAPKDYRRGQFQLGLSFSFITILVSRELTALLREKKKERKNKQTSK